MDELGQMGRITLPSGIQVGVRGYMPGDDDGIIYAPWCNHIRRSGPFAAFTPQEFREHKKGLLERLVASHGVTVACHKDLPQVVHGWVCGDAERRVCHFVYVKDDFRERGIARALLEFEFPALGEHTHYYTHKSRQAPGLADRMGFIYNPYMVMKYKADLIG
jgi:GNAT superfamily N-acetyltransferase